MWIPSNRGYSIINPNSRNLSTPHLYLYLLNLSKPQMYEDHKDTPSFGWKNSVLQTGLCPGPHVIFAYILNSPLLHSCYSSPAPQGPQPRAEAPPLLGSSPAPEALTARGLAGAARRVARGGAGAGEGVFKAPWKAPFSSLQVGPGAAWAQRVSIGRGRGHRVPWSYRAAAPAYVAAAARPGGAEPGMPREWRVRGAAGGPGLALCPSAGASVRAWGAAAPWLSPERSCSCLPAPVPFRTAASPRAVLRKPPYACLLPSRPEAVTDPLLQDPVKKPTFNLQFSLGPKC